MSAEHSFYPSFRDYDIIVWKSLIEVFAMRISCLMDGDSTITYEQYTEVVSPFAIYKMEEQFTLSPIIIILIKNKVCYSIIIACAEKHPIWGDFAVKNCEELLWKK